MIFRDFGVTTSLTNHLEKVKTNNKSLLLQRENRGTQLVQNVMSHKRNRTYLILLSDPLDPHYFKTLYTSLEPKNGVSLV